MAEPAMQLISRPLRVVAGKTVLQSHGEGAGRSSKSAVPENVHGQRNINTVMVASTESGSIIFQKMRNSEALSTWAALAQFLRDGAEKLAQQKDVEGVTKKVGTISGRRCYSRRALL